MSSPVNTILSLGEGSWAFQILDSALMGDQITQGSGVFLSTESQVNGSLIISDELQIYSPDRYRSNPSDYRARFVPV